MGVLLNFQFTAHIPCHNTGSRSPPGRDWKVGPILISQYNTVLDASSGCHGITVNNDGKEGAA